MFTVVHSIYTQSEKLIFLQKKQLTISQDIIGSHFDYWLFHIYKIPLSLKDIKSREERNISTRLFLKPISQLVHEHFTTLCDWYFRTISRIRCTSSRIRCTRFSARTSLLTVLHCKPHESTRMITFKSFQRNPRSSEQKQMLDFPIKNLR